MSEDTQFDFLFYSIGYEERSRFVAEQITVETRIGLQFEESKILSFDENYARAKTRQDTIVSLSKLSEWLNTQFLGILLEKISHHDSVTIGMDVSSLDKKNSALLVSWLLDVLGRYNIELHFLYAPAVFKEPSLDHDRMVNFEALPNFDGWSIEPDLPLSAIIGIGYEEDIALGVIEHLDPSGRWCFVPEGQDKQFGAAILEANESFFQTAPDEHRILYSVVNGLSTLSKLRELCQALAGRSRIIIVPNGPKIFGIISLLVQHEIGDEVSVWTASKHRTSAKVDVKADGTIVKFLYTPAKLDFS